MKYEQFSANTRKAIDELAAVRGVSKEEVVRQFERLFAGRGVSKHQPRVFSLCVSKHFDLHTPRRRGTENGWQHGKTALLQERNT